VTNRGAPTPYDDALELARTIAREQLFAHVRGSDDPDGALEDLAQSIVGTESVVRLIVDVAFEAEAYEPVLRRAADEVGRLFFPDVSKRFVSSIDVLPDIAAGDASESGAALVDERTAGFADEDGALDESAAVAGLPSDLQDYFDLLVAREGVELLTSRLWGESDADSLAARLMRLRRHYPEADVALDIPVSVDSDLSNDEIRNVARSVAAGVSIAFPWAFFSHQTADRVAVATGYLVTHEIRRPPEQLVHEGELPLVALGLGPALRRCGGSINRLLAAAFPDAVRPWMSSHVPAGYWDRAENRRDAVRWLVEDRVGIHPSRIAEAVHDARITKREFSDAGLTWLIKEVYRWSVADALSEAYPELEIWERARRVPAEVWQGRDGKQSAAKAVAWAMDRAGVGPEDVRNRRASRVIQAALRPWHLTAAFSKGFDRDIVGCLDEVYPGEFCRWEISGVPRDDWGDAGLRAEGLLWLLDKLNIAHSEISDAVAQGRLTPASLKDEGLDGILRVTGSLWRAISDVFPGRFARWELGAVPRSHWRSRANVREAVLWTMERQGVGLADLPAAISDGRLDAARFIALGLGSLAMGVFRGDVEAMCRVADVLPSDDYVPLSRFYRASAPHGESPRARRGQSPTTRFRGDATNELERKVRVSRSIRERRRRGG